MDDKTALLFAKTKEFKFVVDKTDRFINWALNQVTKPYVACSFGKDSAVMLHLILKHQPNIDVRFIRWHNETEFIDNYDDIIKEWKDINLTQIEFKRESLSDKRIDRYDVVGYDSFFVGLRQEESVARRITLKKHGKFYKNKSELIRISPLSEWKESHVAAYILSEKLPVLNTYIKQGMSSRTASRIPREDYGIRNSFLSDLKNRDLNAYNNLIKNFPDAKYFI